MKRTHKTDFNFLYRVPTTIISDSGSPNVCGLYWSGRTNTTLWFRKVVASSLSVIDEKDSSKMEICGKGGRDVSATGAEPSGTSEMLTVNDTGNCCARDRRDTKVKLTKEEDVMRFPIPLWETCSLGVPLPVLGPPQQCSYRHFQFDPYGDHLQTCQTQSVSQLTHDWTGSVLCWVLLDTVSRFTRSPQQ